MPFDCVNITLPYPLCNELLTYCNNNYGTNYLWCICMIENTNNYICNNLSSYPLGFIILCLIALLIPIIILFIVCYSLYEKKHCKKTHNTPTVI